MVPHASSPRQLPYLSLEFLRDLLGSAASALLAPPPLPPSCPFLLFPSACPELQARASTHLGALSDLAKPKRITSLSPRAGAPLCSQHGLCWQKLYPKTHAKPSPAVQLPVKGPGRRCYFRSFLSSSHPVGGGMGAWHPGLYFDNVSGFHPHPPTLCPWPCSDCHCFSPDLPACPPGHHLLLMVPSPHRPQLTPACPCCPLF